jgi:hypothetical protein
VSVYGYDAAYPPDPSAVRAAGGQLMACYLTASYAVVAQWPARIVAAGMGALANYEQAADELVYCGRPGGQAAGHRAMTAAIADGFRADGSIGIYFSVDVSVSPAQFPAVGAAFDGINDVIRGKFCTHVYGEGALIDYLIATGRIKPACANWLSGSSSFPGYNPQSPHVGLVQLVGSNIPGTDQNIITRPAGLHAWWPATNPLGVDTMTDAQVATIRSDIANLRAELIQAIGEPTHPSTDSVRNRQNALARQVADAVPAIAAAVWTTPVAVGTEQRTAAQWLANPVNVDTLAAKVAAALPAADPLAIHAAISEGLSNLIVTLSQKV